MMEQDLAEYIDLLKAMGCTGGEIIYLVSIKNQGVTMTKVSYKFNALYDAGEIDGFPDSSIKVLSMFYGKNNLKKMKFETLYDKVRALQRCLTSDPDDQAIIESVKYFKQIN